MVADDAAVRDLYDGPDGVAAGIRSGAVAMDMSTVLPGTIQAVAPAVLARDAGILDAPVSGSVPSARTGQLTIMVGGDAAASRAGPARPRPRSRSRSSTSARSAPARR